jgi:hypothetical protein
LFWHYKIPPLYFWLFSNLEVDIAGNAIVGIFQVVSLCFLAKTTSLDQLIPITYIVFITKLQKKANLRKKDLPLLKNDITGSESTFKMTDT